MNHFNKLPDAFQAEWAASPHAREWTLHNEGTKYWWVDGPNGDVINWECRSFPGCATLIVTTKVVLSEAFRGQGLGRKFRELRHKAYKRAGFQGEIATVRTDNAPQNHLMQTMGATKMGEFPSDFGGSYALWLTKLAPAQTAQNLAPPNVVPVQLPEPGPVWNTPRFLGDTSIVRTPNRPMLSVRASKQFSHRKVNP